MIKKEKLRIYQKNLKIFPLVFTFYTTPYYFFSALYFYYITNSFLITGVVISLGEIIRSLMEVPTGALSDRFLGRKGTQIMADIFQIMGMSVQIFAIYDYRLLFVGAIFIGVALSLYSGNLSSFLHDTLSLAKKQDDYHKEYARMRHYSYLNWSLGILFAGLIAHYLSIRYVLYYCVIQRLFSFISCLLLQEVNFHNKTESKRLKDVFLHMIQSAKTIYQTPKLKKIAIMSIAIDSFNGIDKLNQLFYKTIMSFLQIGFVMSGGLFLCNFASLYSERITKRFGFLTTFLGAKLIAVPLQMIGYTFTNIFSPILIELGASLKAVEVSAESALLHKEFNNKQRATLESIIDLVGSFGYSLFAILFGWLAQQTSLTQALLIGTGLKLFIVPIYIKVLGDHRK